MKNADSTKNKPQATKQKKTEQTEKKVVTLSIEDLSKVNGGGATRASKVSSSPTTSRRPPRRPRCRCLRGA